MHYFSRLTDIVTCNLTSILEEADDPAVALEQLIKEMGDGLIGAERSAKTARRNEQGILDELSSLNAQVHDLTREAKTAIGEGREDDARDALLRKSEVGDLIAGLEQQLKAAIATREELDTTRRALQARLAEAKRRQHGLTPGDAAPSTHQPLPADGSSSSPQRAPDHVEAELEALKRELGNAS